MPKCPTQYPCQFFLSEQMEKAASADIKEHINNRIYSQFLSETEKL